MLLGSLAAMLTAVQIATISTTPSTHPRRVVCRGVNPNEDTMICLWFVSEFGILLRAEKSAKSQVLGSSNASIILQVSIPLWRISWQWYKPTYCSFLKYLFSTPVWFSYWRCDVVKIRIKLPRCPRTTYLDSTDSNWPLSCRKEPSIGRRIREKKPIWI